MIGNNVGGPSYENENSPNEWYVTNGQGLCPWVYSNSWSTVVHFLNYYHTHGATVLGWTTSVSVAKNNLNPGDIIFLESSSDGINWNLYHAMMTTSEDMYDLFMTYHSVNHLGNRLSTIPAGPNQRYVLMRFN